MTVEIDGANNIIKTNTISEVTSANGVTVDGLNIKDSKLVTADSVIEANMSANSVDSDSYVDGSIDGVHLSSNVITGQTALTSVANDDLVLLSDTSASAGLKKMTVANLVANAGGGKVIQMKFSGGGSELMTSSSFNSTGLSVTITPTTTANEILVIAMSPRSYISGIEALYTAIFRGTSGEGSGSSIVQCQNERGGVSGNQRFTNNMMMLDAPSSTSALTYTVMHRNNNNSTLVGWFEGGEVGNSIIVAMEVDIA